MSINSNGTKLAIEFTNSQVSQSALEDLCRQLLIQIGENPDRPGLQDTPKRWAKWWTEFIEYDPGNTETSFESVSTDQMVIVSGIKVWSLCEHHLLPFWCDISIGYIAGDKVLGLSKFARIAHQFAHKLQIQERLTHEIADEVMRLTGSNNVAVLGRGEHLCMVMRGIKSSGLMTSSVMRGVFYEKPEARQEFLSLVKERGL